MRGEEEGEMENNTGRRIGKKSKMALECY